jgi:multidrug efflux system membrane fusion protein
VSRAVVALAALLAAGVAAWALYPRFFAEEKAAAQAGPPVIPVTAGIAEARDMPVYVRGIGTVQAYNTIAIKSRVDGQIVKVDFTEGQEVNAGDPLFEIDPRPFEAALQQASASKQKDEAQLVSAQADLGRYTELVGKGFQTRQIYDQQKATVAQLQAAIKADQAQIDAAQLNLQYATIRSPIRARTGARLVDIGNLVHASDNTALVRLTQLQPIFVSFTVPQNQFNAIRQASRSGTVDVEALAENDQTELATGKLTLIDNEIDQQTGTLHLKAAFANEDETLWPGEFVNLRLVVGTLRNAVTVPARALQSGPKGQYLYVIKPDQTVEMRTVAVAEVEHDTAAVEKGLAAGEQIVVDGQYRLDQGARVRTEPPATAAAEPESEARR